MEINRKNARIWSMMGARGTFGEALFRLAEEKHDFMTLVGDLGKSAGLEKFSETFSDQFLNVGIAEQNLIGIAAGIANEGIPTFAISFAPFITMRCCEQVRMNMGYMDLGVITVGLSAGLEQGVSGNSHYGIEDAAIMRCIPNMTVISPADGIEIVKTVEAALAYKKPVYIRLTGTNNMPIVYTQDYDFQIGKAVSIKDGDDVAIFATGSMVAQAVKVAKQLDEQEIDAAVINIHTIKPIDEEMIKNYANKVKLVVTVEEHSVIGGLGTAVAEVMGSMKHEAALLHLGLPDCFNKGGSYSFMLERYGLTANAIAEQIACQFK